MEIKEYERRFQNAYQTSPSLCFLWPNFRFKFVNLETEESGEVEKEIRSGRRDH